MMRTLVGFLLLLVACWSAQSGKTTKTGTTTTTGIQLCKNLNVVSSSAATAANAAMQTNIPFLHNQIRTHVASGLYKSLTSNPSPPAKNMMRMHYAKDLPTTAMNRAEACFDKTTPIQKNAKYGENWYLVENYTNVDAGLTSAVKHWIGEGKDFVYGVSAHNEFTQVIWSDSYRIACASKRYLDGSVDKLVVVCVYDYKGNMPNVRPYKKGTACTVSPYGYSVPKCQLSSIW